jgi:hypothetical protein
MKKWFRFEIIYQKVNPFSFEKKSTLYTNYQSAFVETIEEAEKHAIRCFELERLGDKIISIKCIND